MDNNPHCAQLWLERKLKPEVNPLIRVLHNNAPTEPYRRRDKEVKTVLHWGQRKLLLSEIEFILKFTKSDSPVDPLAQEEDKQITVVYAGAAPGKHINYLSSLFPDVKFVLVDPNPFSCVPGNKIEIRQTFFTDDMAREFRGKPNILFLCDIRTANHQKQTQSDVEVYIESDMLAQQRWHEIMRPCASLLKFRLPWTSGKTEYLDGTVYLPVWGPQTTSESRLFVLRDAKRREWDNRLYESQMFFFNICTRVQLYKHNVQGTGIDHCFDCASEVYLLTKYLTKYLKYKNDVAKQVALMSEEISRTLSRVRTLADKQPPPDYRGFMGKVDFRLYNNPSATKVQSSSNFSHN